MSKQGRGQRGRFAPKSEEPRLVRAVRLTDSVWAKLGEIAESQGLTRADLIENWVQQSSSSQTGQLTLFGIQHGSADREVITASTRKTGTDLAHRLNISSAALTNWIRYGNFVERSRVKDPDKIAWEREIGTKLYRPIL